MNILDSAKGPITCEAELSLRIDCYIECLQLSSDKVESQTEKLVDAIDSNDTEQTNHLVTEIESVCDKALECVLNLKKFKQEVRLIKIKVAKTTEKYVFVQIVELQNQINSIDVN